MKRTIGAMLLISLAAGLSAADTSDIRGMVTFSGKAPVLVPLRIAGDDFCERVHGQEPITRKDVVVNANSTLKNVVVWVESGLPEGKAEDNIDPGKAVLELQNCSIEPHVIAVQTNQLLQVVNKDETVHNFNARPAANQSLNHTLLPDSEPVSLKFSEPEVAINLRSDIHPWMTAWVAVFDHAAFAVTDDDGEFEIPDLPIGEYHLSAWHEKFGVITLEVLLQRDIPAEVEFTFTDTGSRAASQTNSFSTARPTTGTAEAANITTAPID